jgi:5-methylcytosine-specific restriction protein B
MQSDKDTVAERLLDVFEERESLEWALDLMKDAMDRLGIKNPDDQRIAITLPHYANVGRAFRLNFCQWLVLSFQREKENEEQRTIIIALFADIPELSKYPKGNFACKEAERKVQLYYLPVELIRPFDPKLEEAYHDTFEYIPKRFKHWEATPYRKSHFKELAEAIFDINKRTGLLSRIYGQMNRTLSTLEDLSSETGIETEDLGQWMMAIERKRQAILYGPPGTGKTFLAEHLASYLVSSSEGDGFVELVQFHPAYAYEDFMQGIRPQARPEDSTLVYSVVPGRFLEFCRKAQDRKGTCVLIIDEINRANLARVFGELMYLLEYRNKEIKLAIGSDTSDTFKIPENVRIIGTMNTADRSIALVDHALRRRFAFIKLQPDYEVLRRYHLKENTGFPVDRLIPVLMEINRTINDPNYEIGISFFLKKDLMDHIESIWKVEIEPYLEEYFFDNLQNAENFRWDKVRSSLGL